MSCIQPMPFIAPLLVFYRDYPRSPTTFSTGIHSIHLLPTPYQFFRRIPFHKILTLGVKSSKKETSSPIITN